MLITKTVTINWNSNNKEYYESFGHKYIYRGKIEVPIEHLPKYSKVEVEIECDYCGRRFPNKFSDYLSKKQTLIDKDCCYDCASLKMKEIRDYKQENNMLDKNNNGYWSYKENRLKELDYCIKKYGNLNKIQMSNKDYRTIASFYNYNHSIEEAIQELGYINENVNYNPKNINRDKIYTPKGYYDDINNLVDIIQPFIDEFKRFPTINEMNITLGISFRHIQKHGGIYELKRYMDYSDIYDLRDDNGFYNLSTYEYIVAQVLINNDLSYKRDRHPFPEHEGKFMSDFTFYLKNDEEIHIEVWGGEGQEHYDIVKKKKLKLYQKYNIKLISIGADIFLYFNLKHIQNELNKLFSPYIGKTLKAVPEKNLMPSVNMIDDEIFEELMKHSEDKNYLPKRKVLTKNKKARLYDEVKRRYGSYYAFAEKYNKLVYLNMGYWDVNKIFDVFNDVLVEYNELSKKCIKKYIAKNKKLHNFLDIITSRGGLIKLKLLFIYNNIDNLKLLKNEIKFIKNVLQNSFPGNNIEFSPEQIEMANKILTQSTSNY